MRITIVGSYYYAPVTPIMQIAFLLGTNTIDRHGTANKAFFANGRA